MTAAGRPTRAALYAYGVLILVVLYLPLVAVGFASVSRARYLSFPVKRYTGQWMTEAITSPTVHQIVLTSLKIAVSVTVLSVRYPELAVFRAVSANPFRAPCVEIKYSNAVSPSRKLDWIGIGMIRPEGSAIKPRIPANCVMGL